MESSGERCKLLKEMFSVVDRLEWTSLKHFYASECIYERPGFPVIQGLDALVHFYSKVRTIESGRHELLDFVEQDRKICAFGTFEGTLRSGEVVRLRFADLYLFTGERIDRRQTYFFAPLV